MYKEKGKIVKTPPEEVLDINEIGVPDYTLLNPIGFKEKLTTVYTSRGCPHRCTFCINRIIKNTQWRSLSAENVIKEIELLDKKYGIKVIYFGDECFFVNKERTEKILDLIIEKGIKLKFYGNIRADYFTNGLVNQNLLNKMKKAGFFRVGLSPEFGNQKMRDFIKKDINEKDILTAARMIKKAGLTAGYGFMTAFPNETKEDTLATVHLAKKIYDINKGLIVIKDKERIIDWEEKSRISGPELYRPYPGGELYEYIVKKYNWTSPETIEGWENYFKENKAFKIEEYPWLQLKPDYYKALHLYLKSGRLDFPTFLKRLTLPYSFKLKIASAIFYPFAKIRMTFDFFDFPFEYIIGRRLGLLEHFDFLS